MLRYFVFLFYLQGIYTLNSCEKQTTCHECVTDPTVCVWCAMNELNGTRCKSQNDHPQNWCPAAFLQNPKGMIVFNESVARNFNSDPGNIVQIKPQIYKLKLRPGESVNFNFSFQGAEDYPVDLYFLFDTSASMKEIKSITAMQSEKIYKTMKQNTNDVYLGMGTFVDKNLRPFTDIIDAENTYSFRHRLKLTEDYEEFEKVLTATPLGRNLDVQEGGLDALSQVIVCKDVIGWRNESRKIVVFLTDGPYHAAGDGKTAGLFEPYDGKCYTDNITFLYTKETEMDYPSVGMINKLAKQHEVIIIFVVHRTYDVVYRDLSSAVSGSKKTNYDAKIMRDSDSIVNILNNIYQELSKKIKLKVTTRAVSRSKNVQILFNPDCTKPDNGSDCNVKKGQEQTFEGTIKLLEYDGADKIILDIAIEGISEKLTLDIDVINECECEKSIENSTYCYGEPQQCGICKCGNDRYGDRCACLRNNNNNKYNDNFTCIAEGSTEICSGRGSCFCGTCMCTDRFEGKYCECNKDSCPRDAISGAICNGHGKCECGTCTCSAEWSGDACDCSKSFDDCTGADDKICNNRGTCKCGACECDPIAKWDTRTNQNKLCHIHPCPECHNLQCRILDTCALCHWKTENCDCDNRITLTMIDKLADDHLNSSTWTVCPDLRVDVGCYSRYVYRYTDDEYGVEVMVQKDKDCVKSYLLYGGVFLLTLICVGAATLLAWRLLTDARDRREFKNFLKQHQDDLTGGACDNPIYEPASTTFNNPAFRKRSVDVR